MSKEELIYELKAIGIVISKEQLAKIEAFCHFLMTENKKYNLTAIRDYNDMLLKHVYDSLTIIKAVDLMTNVSLLDIGSGAGFPGIILKIIFPHLHVVLLDANGKKTHFLSLAKKHLNLDNLEIINERAETFVLNHRESFDIVTARAVASLNVLLELGVPYLKETGTFVVMKGNIDNELALGQEACAFLNCEISQVMKLNLPIENSNRTLILVNKNGKTPCEYPRKYDRILKMPLKKKLK